METQLEEPDTEKGGGTGIGVAVGGTGVAVAGTGVLVGAIVGGGVGVVQAEST